MYENELLRMKCERKCISISKILPNQLLSSIILKLKYYKKQNNLLNTENFCKLFLIEISKEKVSGFRLYCSSMLTLKFNQDEFFSFNLISLTHLYTMYRKFQLHSQRTWLAFIQFMTPCAIFIAYNRITGLFHAWWTVGFFAFDVNNGAW